MEIGSNIQNKVVHSMWRLQREGKKEESTKSSFTSRQTDEITWWRDEEDDGAGRPHHHGDGLAGKEAGRPNAQAPERATLPPPARSVGHR